MAGQEEKVAVGISEAIFAPDFLPIVNDEMPSHTLLDVGVSRSALEVYGEDFSPDRRELNIGLEPARGTHTFQGGDGKVYETEGVAVRKLPMFDLYETPETLENMFAALSSAEAAAHEQTNGVFRATPGVRQEDILRPKGVLAGRLFASDWVQDVTHNDGVFPPPAPVKALTFDEDVEARGSDGRMVRVKKGDFMVFPDEGAVTSKPAATQWSVLPIGKDASSKEERLAEATRLVSMAEYTWRHHDAAPTQKPVVKQAHQR